MLNKNRRIHMLYAVCALDIVSLAVFLKLNLICKLCVLIISFFSLTLATRASCSGW